MLSKWYRPLFDVINKNIVRIDRYLYSVLKCEEDEMREKFPSRIRRKTHNCI